MSIPDAVAMQDLLRSLVRFGIKLPSGNVEAAAVLADRSFTTLGGGLRSEDIRRELSTPMNPEPLLKGPAGR